MNGPVETAMEELATANRILFRQGVVDAFGHVSVRSPVNPGRFLMARKMAPELVTAADILELDLDGNPTDESERRVYLERFIHSEIYRTRPDVMSVVHGHSPTVIPFTISSVRLCPVCHISAFLPQCTPVFEIREVTGDGSDMLVSDRERAGAMVRSLGENPVVLMRGHGMTAVGNTIQQAVFRAVYTEINARIQLQAVSLGGAVSYLSESEARASAIKTDAQIGRAWELWEQDLSENNGKRS